MSVTREPHEYSHRYVGLHEGKQSQAQINSSGHVRRAGDAQTTGKHHIGT